MLDIFDLVNFGTADASGRRLNTCNFGGGGGTPTPPKPPKIEIPKIPKMPEIPAMAPPPPPPPPPPNTTTTNDTQSAITDAQRAAQRRKGTGATLYSQPTQRTGNAALGSGNASGTSTLG